MPYLNEIFENGVVINSRTDEHGRPSVSRVVTLFPPVILGGNRTGVVKLNVIEYSEESQSNKIHENKILENVDTEVEVEGEKKEPGFVPGSAANAVGSSGGPSSTMRVAEMLGFVKGNDSKYLPSSASNPQLPYGENTVGAAETNPVSLRQRAEHVCRTVFGIAFHSG